MKSIAHSAIFETFGRRVSLLALLESFISQSWTVRKGIYELFLKEEKICCYLLSVLLLL